MEAPASGERAALRGYRWQYDHIAARVYSALLASDLESLRLTDPKAGRVDDLVLIRNGRVDCYQFRSVEHTRALTFNNLVRNQHTRSGSPAPSLVHSLADGWSRMRKLSSDARVHLVTQQFASVHDNIARNQDTDTPSPDHFSAFLSQVLKPIRLQQITLAEIDVRWCPALAKFHEASGLPLGEFETFLQSLHIDVGAGSGLPEGHSIGYTDIIELSNALQRRVSDASGVVVLNSRDILNLMGWQNRPRLYNRHEFPINLDTYEPLSNAIEQLKKAIACHNRGYLAVIGPPGSGKSTLLSQALSGSPDRLLRYYAYVPGTAATRTRLTGLGFLHDIVLMLGEGGVSDGERELPSSEIIRLQQQFVEQLDAAGKEFLSTGRRTIIVVDGLDHVARDYSGRDGLLGELPYPNELPEGILFVVGSRTLDPLHPYAIQQVKEREGIVDLRQHRLSPASVLKICCRVPVTASLSVEAHHRIVDLSDGHPLALSYLLNRLHDTHGQQAEDILSTLPAYAGDVEAEYLAVWDEVKDDTDIVDILAICSRLRNAFATEWISDWAPSSAVETFRRKLLYLFRRHHNGWRFFHDSFRQFAADRTAWGDESRADQSVDIRVHRRIATLCAEAGGYHVASERLYHAYCAGQYEQVLSLAQQRTFREQYVRLRSPDLIREDIGFALSVAASRADVLAMFRLLLAHVEVTQRTLALDEVDMPGVLHAAGLVDEAISWCGGHGRRIPPSQVYALAARLERAGDPSGRQLFEMIEHKGFAQADGGFEGGLADDAALAWTRAAVLFRPLPLIIESIRNIVEVRSNNSRPESVAHRERWNLYARMIESLIDCFVPQRNREAVETIDSALAEHSAAVVENKTQPEQGDGWEEAEKTKNREVLTLLTLRIELRIKLLELTDNGEDVQTGLETLFALLQDQRVSGSTWLDLSELCYQCGEKDQAARILQALSYNFQLTVGNLGYNGEVDAIDLRFRYWSLAYLLASDEDDVPRSVPPAKDAPAGSHASPSAPVQSDVDAIELAARIDVSVRKLARINAAITSGRGALPSDVWTTLVQSLHVYERAEGRRSGSYRAMERTKSELMEIVVAVAVRYGGDFPQRVSDMLAHKFNEWPQGWPLYVRLSIADQLRSLGVRVPWYQDSLSEVEVNAAKESIDTRLNSTADLVRRYAADGELDKARRLALGMISMAFGIGFQKDHQFSVWVDLLKRALAEPGGDCFVGEAAWLARLLAASDEMSESASGVAATELPAAVVSADPVSAVRIFEFLVRQGTVHHLSALAPLVQALVTGLEADQSDAVILSADITGDLIGPAANGAYPDLATALVGVAKAVLGRAGGIALAESVAERTDKYALRTTRPVWRRALGVASRLNDERDGEDARSEEDEYGALELADGEPIARRDVIEQIDGIEDIITLRGREAERSLFDWSKVLKGMSLSGEEIRALSSAFGYRRYRGEEVQVSLAEAAERSGEQDLALHLALECLRRAGGYSWARYFGGTRFRAAQLAVKLGDEKARVEACKNLAYEISANPDWAGFLIPDWHAIAEILEPGLAVSTMWPEIRVYLEGMAEPLTLAEEHLLADRRCRWWLLASMRDQRGEGGGSSVAAALAEVVVGHLSHPTWLVRDAAAGIVVRALGRGNKEVAEVLGRFAQPDASDDIVERAGRCLAAARVRYGYVPCTSLESLENLLANHPSQVIRSLAGDQLPRSYRSLSPMYHLALPSPADDIIGSQEVVLWPYEEDYQLLAGYLQLDPNTLRAIAARYATQALEILPKEEAVRNALGCSHLKCGFPSYEIAASRAAFGRVLAEVVDARLLDAAQSRVRTRLFRTIDLDLIGLSPDTRPSVIPTPTAAGHDQTIERWQQDIGTRLEEYIACSTSKGCILIGAKCRLAVLNWGRLEEDFVCVSTIGADETETAEKFAPVNSAILRDLITPTSAMTVNGGTPLILQNEGFRFHQITADWISFHPGLARTLAWAPDEGRPGCWNTEAGDRAVETVWWMDGWWGRFERAFDDTEAGGHAVILTSTGAADLVEKFGVISRHFKVTRRGLDDGRQTQRVLATRSLQVTL